MDGAIRAQPRRLVLASTSKYRRALLERLGLAFETAAPRVDERALHGESPADTALRLSGLKAQAVDRAFPDALIIGSDQVAAMGRERFGKPGDHATAARQLRSLSGNAVDFHTAVTVLDAHTRTTESRVLPYRVVFRTLDARRIEAYLLHEKHYNCEA